MKIQVTRDHINRGKPWQPNSCPVALAIEEQYGVPCAVKPGLSIISFFSHADVILPDKVCRFAAAFDHGRPVKPFEFELDLEVES